MAHLQVDVLGTLEIVPHLLDSGANLQSDKHDTHGKYGKYDEYGKYGKYGQVWANMASMEDMGEEWGRCEGGVREV